MLLNLSRAHLINVVWFLKGNNIITITFTWLIKKTVQCSTIRCSSICLHPKNVLWIFRGSWKFLLSTRVGFKYLSRSFLSVNTKRMLKVRSFFMTLIFFKQFKYFNKVSHYFLFETSTLRELLLNILSKYAMENWVRCSKCIKYVTI